ncbi:MAG: membrane associated rhomboid family serine protease [Arenicella sp.]|jgi:membrane associated rhomboid family serine protease
MPSFKELLSSMTNRLVFVTVFIYFAVQQGLFANALTGFEMFSWQTSRFELWQLGTHIFLHGSVSHLAFNMLALWSFGRILEKVWGIQRFLIFYLVCGVGAAVISQLVDQFVLGPVSIYNVTVGASGAIYGLLVAFALMFPNFKIMLIFLPVPIAAKHFVPVLLLIDLTAGFTGFSIFGQNIAHFAHLGGALAGFLMVNYYRRSTH